MKKATGFQRFCLKPKNARDKLPINWAIVSIGTAIVVPMVLLNNGNNNNAPPKPDAPEIAAAIKLPAKRRKYIHSVFKFIKIVLYSLNGHVYGEFPAYENESA